MSDEQYDEAIDAIAKHTIARNTRYAFATILANHGDVYPGIPDEVRPGITQRIAELIGNWELGITDELEGVAILQDRVASGYIDADSYKP